MAEWAKGGVIGFANPLVDPLGVERFLATEATAFSASSQKLTVLERVPMCCNKQSFDDVYQGFFGSAEDTPLALNTAGGRLSPVLPFMDGRRILDDLGQIMVHLLYFSLTRRVVEATRHGGAQDGAGVIARSRRASASHTNL